MRKRAETVLDLDEKVERNTLLSALRQESGREVQRGGAVNAQRQAQVNILGGGQTTLPKLE